MFFVQKTNSSNLNLSIWFFFSNDSKQAWAELGQALVKLDDILVVVVKAMVKVEVQLLFQVGGGWSDKTKLILISTLVEVLLKLKLSLAKYRVE